MEKNTLSIQIVEAMDNSRQMLHNAITFGVIAATSEMENHHEAIVENAWNLMVQHLHQLEDALHQLAQVLELHDAL